MKKNEKKKCYFWGVYVPLKKTFLRGTKSVTFEGYSYLLILTNCSSNTVVQTTTLSRVHLADIFETELGDFIANTLSGETILDALKTKPDKEADKIIDELKVTDITPSTAKITALDSSTHYVLNETMNITFTTNSGRKFDLGSYGGDLVVDDLTWTDNNFPAEEQILQSAQLKNPEISFNQLQIRQSDIIYLSDYKAGICALYPKTNSNLYLNECTLIVVKKDVKLNIGDFIMAKYLGICEETNPRIHVGDNFQQVINYQKDGETLLTDDSCLADDYINPPTPENISKDWVLEKVLYKNKNFINEFFIKSLTVDSISAKDTGNTPQLRATVTSNLSFLNTNSMSDLWFVCIPAKTLVYKNPLNISQTSWVICDLKNLEKRNNNSGTSGYPGYIFSVPKWNYGFLNKAFTQKSFSSGGIWNYWSTNDLKYPYFNFYLNWDIPLSMLGTVPVNIYDNSLADINIDDTSLAPLTAINIERTAKLPSLYLASENNNKIIDFSKMCPSYLKQAPSTERIICNDFKLEEILKAPKLQHIYLNNMAGSKVVTLSDAAADRFSTLSIHRPVGSNFSLTFKNVSGATISITTTYINDNN